MPTSYTTNLRLSNPGLGDTGWGTTVSDGMISLVDPAIAGTTTLSTDADVTLTTANGAADQARQMILNCTGSRAAQRTITAPASSKVYVVINGTTGGFGVKLVGVGPTTGVVVPAGRMAVLAWNGSDFVTLGAVVDLTASGNVTVAGTTTLAALTASGNVSFDGGAFVFNESGADRDARFEGDTDANLLFLDASTDRVGIGTSSPGAKLHMLVASASNVELRIGNTQSYASVIENAVGEMQLFTPGTAMTFSTDSVERMRLDTSGNLGIGTSSPGAKLDVNGAAIVRGFLTPTDAIKLGGNTSAPSTTDAFIYRPADNTLAFGTASTERARITSGGEVYIAGTTDQGAYNLQVNGTGVWGAGAYVNGSDERLKDNIQTLNDGLSVVSQLRPVTFQYKPEHSKDQSVQPGFIAQELQQAMAGKDYLDGVVQSGPEYLNVAYQSLIPILTKAIQEQQALITALTARVAALEAN